MEIMDRRKITAPINGKRFGGRPKGSVGTHTLDVIEAKKWFIAQVHKDLVPIYEALYKKALTGDTLAIKELLDRSWGKAVQGVEHTGKDGNPIIFLPLELIQKHALQIGDNDVQSVTIDGNKDVKLSDNGSV